MSLKLNPEQQRRLDAVVAFLHDVADVADTSELVTALLQAAAIWYDLEGFGYRRDLSGRFRLEAALPGADRTRVRESLSSEIGTRHPDVERLPRLHDSRELLGRGDQEDVLLVPLAVGTSPEWLLTFSGPSVGDAEQTLRTISPVMALLLERWALRQAARLQDQLLEAMLPSGGGPAAVADPVLYRLCEGTGAAGARLLVWTRAARGPRVVATVGTIGDLGLEPETATQIVTADRLLMPFEVGHGVVIAVDLFASPGRRFTPMQSRLAWAGAVVMKAWFVGAFDGGAVTSAVSGARAAS